MNQDELASQLSAMFDGELPAAECELLSRRLARDEQLRATWSRYSVIGAALRAEPLAQVRPDFARRVSAALAGSAPARVAVRRGRLLRGAAFGSAVAAGVAGVAIMMLRNDLPVQELAAASAPAPSMQLA
ncbi:MAG: sigma-E factor negative regulatory protein, partial [Proteobacteria bacterium]|nr:sigma-E factor negative regulatory protein [Pseudomonadota bacterium]